MKGKEREKKNVRKKGKPSKLMKKVPVWKGNLQKKTPSFQEGSQSKILICIRIIIIVSPKKAQVPR